MNVNKGLGVAAVIAYNREAREFSATYLVDGAKVSRTLFARDAAEAKAKIALYHVGQKISGLTLKS